MLQKTQEPLLMQAAAPMGLNRLTAAMRGICQWAVIDEGDRVLDMDCGSGALLRALAQKASCQLCGMTQDVERSRQARCQLPDADILFAQPEDIPWHDEAFDLVVCTLPLNAMDNPKRSLSEVLRVLKKGGQFLLANPWYPSPLRQLVNHFSFQADEGKGPACYSRQDIMAALEAAGFENVTWHTPELGMSVTVGWRNRTLKETQ